MAQSQPLIFVELIHSPLFSNPVWRGLHRGPADDVDLTLRLFHDRQYAIALLDDHGLCQLQYVRLKGLQIWITMLFFLFIFFH